MFLLACFQTIGSFRSFFHKSENVVRDPLWPSSSGWEVELSSNIGRYQQNFQMDCCTQRRFDFSFPYAMASKWFKLSILLFTFFPDHQMLTRLKRCRNNESETLACFTFPLLSYRKGCWGSAHPLKLCVPSPLAGGHVSYTLPQPLPS